MPDEDIVPTDVALLDQAPDTVESLRVMVEPMQAVEEPTIEAGAEMTESVAEVVQLPPRV
jgi:hypothetical protein